ncbi:MAG TPA: DUF488 family protein [Myxococcaceae bacterium]|nr:DUF488 family protein [Myxococcaceae bacterium]
MPIRTRRWNDPGHPDDGLRVLICRYRPRGVPKAKETWDVWKKQLGPSVELHADYYGKHGPPIDWATYRKRYLAEMKAQKGEIRALAEKVKAGETMTLLCSSACTDETHCHRTLLRELIEAAT